MSNPPINAATRATIEQVIASGVEAYLTEFTTRLFPNIAASDAQDCIVNGIAAAIREYQKTTGRPIAAALAAALTDKE